MCDIKSASQARESNYVPSRSTMTMTFEEVELT